MPQSEVCSHNRMNCQVFILCFLYVYVCVCRYIHLKMWCICTCGDQMTALCIDSQEPSTLLIWWGRSLISLDKAGLWASSEHSSFVSSCLELGFSGVHYGIWPFYVCFGFHLESSWLHDKFFTDWAISLALFFFISFYFNLWLKIYSFSVKNLNNSCLSECLFANAFGFYKA